VRSEFKPQYCKKERGRKEKERKKEKKLHVEPPNLFPNFNSRVLAASLHSPGSRLKDPCGS
jgi:hypothetical protein